MEISFDTKGWRKMLDAAHEAVIQFAAKVFIIVRRLNRQYLIGLQRYDFVIILLEIIS
jgi:hypothetical protein